MKDANSNQDIIFDHYKNPRNNKLLDDFDIRLEAINPACGDKIKLDLKLLENVVNKIGYEITGCVLSKVSASICSELWVGKSKQEINDLSKKLSEFLKNISNSQDLGDLLVFENLQKFPIRHACVELVFKCFRKDIEQACK